MFWISIKMHDPIEHLVLAAMLSSFTLTQQIITL